MDANAAPKPTLPGIPLMPLVSSIPEGVRNAFGEPGGGGMGGGAGGGGFGPSPGLGGPPQGGPAGGGFGGGLSSIWGTPSVSTALRLYSCS